MSTFWRPEAVCRTECAAAPYRQVGLPRRAGRTVAAASLIALAMLMPRFPPALARALLRALGVRLRVTGAVGAGVLLVGNHVSWLDIVVVQALGRVRAVAKVEVGQWPLIGRMGRARGMILVDRARPRQLPRTVAQVAEALRAGETVQVFPEGTTTCGGEHAAPWRPAFLQAALDADAPVQRFQLSYNHPGAAFVDDETLLGSLARVLRMRDLSAEVVLTEPQPAYGGRRELTRRISGVVPGSFTARVQVLHSEVVAGRG